MDENNENQENEVENNNEEVVKGDDTTGKRTRQSRTTKHPLPDPRMTIETQIKVMKALNIATSKGKTLVTYQEVAPLAGMHPTLVSGALGFFQKIDLIKKEGSKYSPQKGMTDFCNELEWNEEGAGDFFRKLILNTWFGEYTLKLFKLHKEMSKEALLSSLGHEAEADKSQQKQLMRIIEFLEYGNVIELDETSNKYKLNDFDLSQNKEESLETTPKNPEKEEIQINKSEVSKEILPENKVNTIDKITKNGGLVINVNVSISEDTNTDILAKKILELKEKLNPEKHD